MITSADPEIVVREKDVLRWALEREKVAPITDPHDFYRHAHAVIWSAVLSAKASGLSPDYLTVKQILLERGQLEAVDPLYLHDLSRDSVRPSDAALASAAAQIKQHAQKRLVKSMLGKLADETDINVIIATLEKLKAARPPTRDPFLSAKQVAEAAKTVAWVVRGYLARGASTELVGRAKWSGKTTLLGFMARCIMDGLPCLGGETLQGPVVWLTEQPPGDLPGSTPPCRTSPS